MRRVCRRASSLETKQASMRMAPRAVVWDWSGKEMPGLVAEEAFARVPQTSAIMEMPARRKVSRAGVVALSGAIM